MAAITLNSGFKMPIIGLGVWRMEGKDIKDLLLNAIKIGYRHFDCAADYQNEVEVGEALAEAFKAGLVKREDLFITTKLWNSDHGHVVEACKASLKKLQLDYLDLFLVHFQLQQSTLELVQLQVHWMKRGCFALELPFWTMSYGRNCLQGLGSQHWHKVNVNYDIFLTRDCLAYSKVKPAINQIETHPYFQRESLVKFCQKHGIAITAHTPLGGSVANTEWFGSVSCLDDPDLKALAEKYKKTVAQVVLRWGIQRNTIIIPKSSKSERLEENFKVFDFELSKEDMELIKNKDRKYRTNNPSKFWGIDLYA
ncbi:hypothetical protein OSB04_014199 [Centaurea solstitialis]|uniref:NADP-dependent oxidoreductase domain-containing protein n=1 Tax=Centaurea solstitialis TaxID=347529 RepID=A0AA38SWN0_9ASTR|nr:hypothetical protein OSB04_014199 [Centaurea solstitialis]